MDALETSLYTAVLITGVVFICLTVFFAFSAIWHQRKHIRIQRQNFLDEISLLEKERNRVACDLHDELAPVLSLARFQVLSLASELPQEGDALQNVGLKLERVMLRLGEIAHNLNASTLVRKGLEFALSDFLLEIESLGTLRVSFVYDVAHDVPPVIGIHLYRIVQEVAQNSLKHAEASALEVHVKERFGKLFLFLRDDGRGFSYSRAVRLPSGIGLQSIRSRTGMLGGKFQCRSSPQRGTSFFLEIPFTSSLRL